MEHEMRYPMFRDICYTDKELIELLTNIRYNCSVVKIRKPPNFDEKDGRVYNIDIALKSDETLSHGLDHIYFYNDNEINEHKIYNKFEKEFKLRIKGLFNE